MPPQVTFPFSSNDPTELKPLLDACSPALFGLSGRALQDDRVCKALQLPADRLGFGLANAGVLPSEDILDDVRDLMIPDAAGPIRAELHALDVYSPDGEAVACTCRQYAVL
jgi:hypothetical protein